MTLSMDTSDQTREGMGKHNAKAIMLADSDMTVTRLLGLENTAPKVAPPGLIGLPIPTTILLDADHIVKWIDQATDYQVRASPERVHAALVEGLGAPLEAMGAA